MKKSNYIYFFIASNSYVGYSYLADDYVVFPFEYKRRVTEILDNPDILVFDDDVEIYKKLISKKFLIKDIFNEYQFMQSIRRKYINKQDFLSLTILPTMACNCRCNYCFEMHPDIKNSKMTLETAKKINNLIDRYKETVKNIHISWFGGEPLYCMDVIEYISKKVILLSKVLDIKFHFFMTTNGVLLNKKNIEVLTENGINSLQITLDGDMAKHDITRVTINKSPTFNIIMSNIINYLKYSDKNSISLRIHYLPSNNEKDFVHKILDTLKIIPKEVRSRIRPYIHHIFTEYTEEFGRKESKNKCQSSIEQTTELDIGKLNNGFKVMGFELSKNTATFDINPSACNLEPNNSLVIDPEGYLLMCSMAVEKERAIGMLATDGSIAYNYSRLQKVKNSEFNAELHEYCKDCKLLPFCWNLCHMIHYQNANNKNFVKNLQCKNKMTWIAERALVGIKNVYMKKVEENNENR